MIRGMSCQANKYSLQVKVSQVKFDISISFWVHGDIFCTAENSLIGHNLTRDVWLRKIQRLLTTDPALNVVESRNLQRSIDRRKESGKITQTLQKRIRNQLHQDFERNLEIIGAKFQGTGADIFQT